jgi:two-component system, LuxR family, response regulator FixJ
MLAEPTVFVVDDDPAARDSVAVLADSHGVRAETFASAEQFLGAFDPQRPGCLVIDVRMPGMNGLDLQETLSTRGNSLPVIMITAYADVPMTVRAMENGALTLLEKPCTANELWARIQEALHRNAQFRLNCADRQDVLRRLNSLTEDETRVLDLVLAGRPNKQIAAELSIGLRTAELRRARVMEKMRVESLSELVRLVLTARGQAA